MWPTASTLESRSTCSPGRLPAPEVEPVASEVEQVASEVEPVASEVEPVASEVEPVETLAPATTGGVQSSGPEIGARQWMPYSLPSTVRV